ncbi:SpaH/EbpB family LPXTG-anchored major pilin [Canibacter sp. lx-72]|uniref:SpaH/EbpB family LPXTG-anchored major pilin n=1 Tax=Canibacter zhuwentaonis TaxID=2837491 RepID=UPI001BDCA04C|nr:SpaH/EbpB family LPXTG-anchored major pilin [Canibacter zhuwentaonis]MBT1018410.1 SpaH/EbpB family LPXTG-anchored major pilin [Canibacter zhuwentaonis]
MKLKKVAAIAVLPALVAGGLILTQPANAAAPGDIDPNQTGSIIVHKHGEPAGVKGAAGDGKEQAVAPEKPLQGAMFSVQKISGVDLTIREGWQQIADVSAKLQNGTTPALDAMTTAETTNMDGIANFRNLSVGAYLVTETQTPAGALKKVNPFIVTVPHPNGNGDWNYNVHVYPKNSVVEKPEKSFDDSQVTKLGDKIRWTVTQTLPELTPGVMFTEVSFSDTLAANLQYVEDSMVVKVDGVGVDFTDVIAGQDISAEVTEPGVLQPGQRVTYEFDTMIVAAGEIKNVANVTVATSDGGSSRVPSAPSPNDPSVPSIIIGHIDVQNYVTGTMTAISGGVFEVYKGEDCAGGKIDLGVLTAGDDGRLAQSVALKKGKYGVRQVTAAVGYVASTDCVSVEVVAANTADDPVFATVYNSKATVPVLPLTGAQGQVIMLAAGGMLVAIGLVTVVIVCKKRRLAESK